MRVPATRCDLYWVICSPGVDGDVVSIAGRQRLFINGAIGVQVIVGALTTGVAATGSAHVWSFSQSSPL